MGEMDKKFDQDLFKPVHWPWAQVRVRFWRTMPDPEYIQSVHLVCIVDDAAGSIVIVREAAGPFTLPGGTREPAETLEDCARRELVEEAGVTAVGQFHWVGAHVGIGYKDRPYRDHLPHPLKAWAWGVVRVTHTGNPSNPPGAEQIVEVRNEPIENAKKLLAERDYWYPALVDEAVAHLRQQ